MTRALPLLLLTVWVGVAAAAPTLPGSRAELESVASLDAGKYATARRQAEAVLAEGPSIVATFVLGSVHYRGEGNHPRGLFLVQRALTDLEAEYGAPPADEVWQLWHKRMLMEKQWLLGEMDRREDQLAALDEHDRYYKPPQAVRRIWPLLKLGRFDEARAIGERFVHDEKPWMRERAFNGLMAIEDEARNRQASYDWGMRGHLDSQGKSCIIATNLALAARRCFRFGEAERFDKAALEAKDGSCPTSPYNQLAVVNLIQGKFQQSLAAIKSLRKVPRSADVRVQNEMDIRARLSELLFALGQLEPAEARVREIIARPDRAGLTSASAENIRLANHTLFFSVITARIHQLRERAAVRDLVDGWGERWAAEQLEATRWEHLREAMKLAAEPDLLVDMVRPYYTDVMPWYSGTLIQMFGAGVVHASLAEAQAREDDFPEVSGAYMTAMAGEVAWRRGAMAEAARLGGEALAHLPPEAVLLQHRVRAWRADARMALGEDASDDLEAVLQRYPTVLRQLDIAVPVRLVDDGSALARDAADRLEDSPRLSVQSASAFEVRIEAAAPQVSVCLYTRGLRLGCAEPAKDDPEGDAGLIAVLDRFHDQALAPKVELTQSDLNSLDGRPQRVSADEALKGMLGDGP